MRGFVVVIVGALVAVTCLAALAGSAGARSTNGYRALGATVKTFNSDNPSCPGAAPPAQYAYCYKITATKRGRVTAFHVVINARNAYSARKRLALAIAMVPLPTRATK